MPNVTILPPNIQSGRIYLGDQAGYDALPAMPAKTEEERQREADANRAWVQRVAALQAERQAEMDRGKLPFEDVPGVYKPVWRGNELAMEIDPNAMSAATAAVEAATQFQGIRGYQQALEQGKTPAQAMTEFAPLIFAKKYPSSLAAQAAAASRVHNIGGVGYMQDPQNPMGLVPVTAPKLAAVEEVDLGGTKTPMIRQPSGALTPIPSQQDLTLKDLEAEKRSATKALRDAQAKHTAATATREEITPPSTGIFGTGIMARPSRTNVVELMPGKADEAAANLQAAEQREKEASAALESYLGSRRGPVTAPVTAPRKPTQADVNEAMRKAGRDRAKATQLLKEAGFTLD